MQTKDVEWKDTRIFQPTPIQFILLADLGKPLHALDGSSFISSNIESCAMNHEYAIHVLKLPVNFSMESLRANYKRMALLLHPDRRVLDVESANQLFSILTDSYKFLKIELDGGSSSSNDADWMVMRSHADQHNVSVPEERSSGRSGSGSDFNIDSFNTTFSDTRLGDENDRGYSSWMARLTPDAAAVKQRRKQEDERERVSRTSHDSLTFQEPEGLPSSTSIPHSELGISRVRDFGRHADVGGKRGDLAYTDYVVAHMTASCLIDPEIVRARPQFNNIEEYERARGASESSSITSEEKAAISRREAMAATREDRRMNALRNRDELVSRHHAKIHMNALT